MPHWPNIERRLRNYLFIHSSIYQIFTQCSLWAGCWRYNGENSLAFMELTVKWQRISQREGVVLLQVPFRKSFSSTLCLLYKFSLQIPQQVLIKTLIHAGRGNPSPLVKIHYTVSRLLFIEYSFLAFDLNHRLDHYHHWSEFLLSYFFFIIEHSPSLPQPTQERAVLRNNRLRLMVLTFWNWCSYYCPQFIDGNLRITEAQIHSGKDVTAGTQICMNLMSTLCHVQCPKSLEGVRGEEQLCIMSKKH